MTGINTKTKKNKIEQRIIQHLIKKKDHKDDLDGITLFVYEKELKDLSGEITDVIIKLLSQGLLLESKDSLGQKLYQLADNQSSISDYLLEK